MESDGELSDSDVSISTCSSLQESGEVVPKGPKLKKVITIKKVLSPKMQAHIDKLADMRRGKKFVAAKCTKQKCILSKDCTEELCHVQVKQKQLTLSDCDNLEEEFIPLKIKKTRSPNKPKPIKKKVIVTPPEVSTESNESNESDESNQVYRRQSSIFSSSAHSNNISFRPQPIKNRRKRASRLF